jgi:hypothetical protein
MLFPVRSLDLSAEQIRKAEGGSARKRLSGILALAPAARISPPTAQRTEVGVDKVREASDHGETVTTQELSLGHELKLRRRSEPAN